MDIKSIIVREYLESLKESDELDYIFGILLESQGFILLSKPKEYKGMSQYGKDIVAVGKDFEDGIEKRFYFELKGGSDKDITTDNFIRKKDSIKESLVEAKYKPFEFTNKKHAKLPLKIVLVHNGELKANAKETFEGVVNREFPGDGDIEFDRWGISELTKLFSDRLFGAFLLPDRETTTLFNKVIVNLDVTNGVSIYFIRLLDVMFDKLNRNDYKKKLPRTWVMFFESLRLISLIIHTESKNYNNLDIAKRYVTHLVIRLWYWVLKNKLEQDRNINKYAAKIAGFYIGAILSEYFDQTLPIALKQDGLFAENGGRYEQIGYTNRTFEYLQYLCFFLETPLISKTLSSERINNVIIGVINSNSVASRPLLDINSIPIINVLVMLIRGDRKDAAKSYLTDLCFFIRFAKEKYNRLPDANNSITNVIKYIITNEKPIYYSDSTSSLLAIIMEFIAILDMEKEYYKMRDFINSNNIDLGIFIPHHGKDSTSKELIEDKENDLEEQLFSKNYFHDGYQSDMRLYKDFDKELNFEEFKQRINNLKEEFTYDYRTEMHFLRDLAHIYYQTPYFPDKWRCLFDVA